MTSGEAEPTQAEIDTLRRELSVANDMNNTEETADDIVRRLRHYAKLLGWELPGVLDTAADMIEDMIEELNRVRAAERERCAMLHENVNPASDDERLRGTPGAGAMGAMIEYRDMIRS